jgi:CheY-like chemotaxis protein
MLADNLDCHVRAFTRPLDALQALPQLNPSVVITDYFMPQLNGFEFMRRANALVPMAAFLMITGHNLAEIADDVGKSAALKGVLAKPFGWRKLADEIIRVWPSHTPAPSHRADLPSL